MMSRIAGLAIPLERHSQRRHLFAEDFGRANDRMEPPPQTAHVVKPENRYFARRVRTSPSLVARRTAGAGP